MSFGMLLVADAGGLLCCWQEIAMNIIEGRRARTFTAADLSRIRR
jgi:hypothetical protein